MTTSLVRTRYGVRSDGAAVTAMLEHCSDESLRRRFHVPRPRVTDSLVTALVVPARGWSVVAELGGEVVGIASVGALSGLELEVGLLVPDAHQRRGIGARLLLAVAAEARVLRYRCLLCFAQPDNHGALGAARRAGLPAATRLDDGVLEVRIGLHGHRAERPA